MSWTQELADLYVYMHNMRWGNSGSSVANPDGQVL